MLNVDICVVRHKTNIEIVTPPPLEAQKSRYFSFSQATRAQEICTFLKLHLCALVEIWSDKWDKNVCVWASPISIIHIKLSIILIKLSIFRSNYRHFEWIIGNVNLNICVLTNTHAQKMKHKCRYSLVIRKTADCLSFL